jgi:hypothetical protein
VSSPGHKPAAVSLALPPASDDGKAGITIFIGGSMETRVHGQREDQFTGAIESQTSKIPSAGYLGAALGSMAASAILKILGKDEWALFVGQWAPSFLIMGVYNKLVKQLGSDLQSRHAA